MKKTLVALSLLALPAVASAQNLSNVERLVESLGGIIGLLIPIVFALALLFFFWGVAKYILASGEGKEEGKKIMIWGVVALFVMGSVWGIVEFLQNALGVDNTTAPTVDVPGRF